MKRVYLFRVLERLLPTCGTYSSKNVQCYFYFCSSTTMTTTRMEAIRVSIFRQTTQKCAAPTAVWRPLSNLASPTSTEASYSNSSTIIWRNFRPAITRHPAYSLGLLEQFLGNTSCFLHSGFLKVDKGFGMSLYNIVIS